MQLGRKNKTYESRILDLIDNFDKTWYKKMKSDFDTLAGGEDYYVIDTTPAGYQDYLETLTDEEKAFDNTVLFEELDFERHCFTTSKSTPGDLSAAITSITNIAKEILSNANAAHQDTTTIKGRVMDIVVAQIEVLTKEYDNQQYISILKSLKRKIADDLHNAFYDKEEAANFLSSADTRIAPIQTQQPTGMDNPIFDPAIIGELLTILTKYFPKDFQVLPELLAGSEPYDPLQFHGNGNQLADCFKKLYDKRFITGCTKKELINWIYRNFTYKSRGQINRFNEGTLEDEISSTEDRCKKPIISIIKDKATSKYWISSY
jgi:hypothetical protein